MREKRRLLHALCRHYSRNLYELPDLVLTSNLYDMVLLSQIIHVLSKMILPTNNQPRIQAQKV